MREECQLATPAADPTPGPPAARAAQARTLMRLARVLERTPDTLALPQYRVLSFLLAGESRASEIAGRLALTKPAVSVAVDGLVAAGLVCRGEVAGDRRGVALVPTEAGIAALERADSAYARALGDLLAALPDGLHGPTAGAFLTGLTALAQVLDERRAAHRATAAGGCQPAGGSGG